MSGGIQKEKRSKLKIFTTVFIAALLVVSLVAFQRTFALNVPVYGNDLAGAGWQAYTTDGGNVSFVYDSMPPIGSGVARLTTPNDVNARARLTTYLPMGTSVKDITEMGYMSKVTAANIPEGSVSYAVEIDVDGNPATNDRTSLVHEPYWQNAASPDPAPVERDIWQSWNVMNGVFWSSIDVGTLFEAGSGGPPFYDLAEVKSIAPNAKVVSISVYIGSYNPSYVTYVDKVSFNGTVYDFEVEKPATPPSLISPDQCKNGGWKTLLGKEFKNQGQCVSYFEKASKVSTTKTLDSTSADGVSFGTTAGKVYRVNVSGTWQNTGQGNQFVDAECINTNGAGWVPGFTGYSPDLLDVQVNKTFVNWGPCNTDNEYKLWVIGDGSDLSFRVFDGNTATNEQIPGWLADNVGSLTVKVSEL